MKARMHLLASLSLGISTSVFAPSVLHGQAADSPLTLSSTEASTTSIIELGAPPKLAKNGEQVRQRFPNGNIQIERWVVENENGDFVNSGPYTEYDESGTKIVSGNYVDGLRDGIWNKRISAEEAKQLSGAIDRGFSGPFESRASFLLDQLHGEWSCIDSQGNRVFVWSFADGMRNGTSTWFNAKGEAVQTINYNRNLADGAARVVVKAGSAPQEIEFQAGRMLRRIEKFFPAEKGKDKILQAEDWYLSPTTVNLESHDWEANIVVSRTYDASDLIRHGSATTFYSNGQRESEGFYENGKRTGVFSWWYSNGQEKTVGEYLNDEEQGTWTWWHENGMREARGNYANGVKVEDWSVWNPEGKLVKRTEASEARVAKRTTEDIELN